MTIDSPGASPATEGRRDNRSKYVVILLVLSLITFGRLCTSEFTSWDDELVVSGNPNLNPPTIASVMQYWTLVGDQAPMNIYCPMTYMAWGGLAKIAYLDSPDSKGVRLNPFVFHTANVIVHMLTVVAAFTLLSILLKNDRAAIIGAAIYAVHPVMVEPVAWVAGLKDLLAGMFGMLALLAYTHWRRTSTAQSKWLYTVGVLLCAAAIFSKASAMVLPLLALVLELLILKTPTRRAITALLPWFALAMVGGTIAKLSQPVHHEHVAPLWATPFLAGDSLVFYLGKIVAPIHLAIDYGRRPDLVIHSKYFWFAWCIPAALVAVAYLLRRWNIFLFAGACWFVMALIPVLGFVPFVFQYYSSVSDHYLYVSMFGVALIVGGIMARLRSPVVTAIVSIIIAALAVRSIVAAGVWRTDESLHRHALSVNPNSFAALMNLSVSAAVNKDMPQAIELSKRAATVNPDHIGAHENVAVNLFRTGNPGAALDWVSKAMQLHADTPREARVITTRTKVWLARACMAYRRMDLAKALLDAAQQDTPNDPDVVRQFRDYRAREVATTRATTVPSTAPGTVPSSAPK